MIRFVARRTTTGKLTIGLVLLPEDIALLLSGQPQLTKLRDVDAENPIVADVILFAFRDLQEFQEAMQDAGLDARMIATTVPDKPGEETQRFKAPPVEKIKDN